MLILTFKDSIVSREIDEEWNSALYHLNAASQSGKDFAVMETVNGHIMVNIKNILCVEDADDIFPDADN